MTLGVIYRLTFAPLAIPAALHQTIEREARALAAGDRSAFQQLLDIDDFTVQQALLNQVKAWGIPERQSLYDIIDFGLLSDTEAWVDVSQYRNGDRFREMRFYRWRDGQWRRSATDPQFWSGAEVAVETAHFRVVYAVEDQDRIRPIVAQLEHAYEQFCADLGCATGPRQCVRALGQAWCTVYPDKGAVILHLSSIPHNHPWKKNFQIPYVDSPSPRLGVYQSSKPIGVENIDGLWTLATILTNRTAGWPTTLDRGALLWAIARWSVNRLLPLPGGRLTAFKPDLSQMISLRHEWEPASPENWLPAYFKAYALVQFIEATYGTESIAPFLKAVGQSHSFSEAIWRGLDVPFSEFDQKWQAWVKQNIVTQ